MRITELAWESARLFEIAEEGGLCVRVSDLGGLLQSAVLPDGWQAVLGYDTPEEYLCAETFFGACIGPIADRMTGGSCVLGGETVILPCNAGPDAMHSGSNGFHRHKWNAELLPDGVRLYRSFTRADTGFPGTLDAQISVRVHGTTLRLEYAAKCDRETAVSFTNHSYFRLGEGSCREQILRVNASRYAETTCTDAPACTGAARSVEGTPLDLRCGTRIGDALDRTDFPEIASAGGIDHYFLVDGEGMREHARLTAGARELICRSDAPGVLVYTANGLTTEPGRGGEIYGQNTAVCLETERFPNAVNLPNLRSGVLLRPGEVYESATEFCFKCRQTPVE